MEISNSVAAIKPQKLSAQKFRRNQRLENESDDVSIKFHSVNISSFMFVD